MFISQPRRPRRSTVSRSPEQVLQPGRRGSGSRALPPPGRRRMLLVLAAVAVVVLAVVGAFAIGVVRSIDTPLAVGAWSTHRTAATGDVTDAGGTVWTPDPSGLSGGDTRSTPSGDIPTATGSPGLYRSARLGATSWTVQVPQAGRYSVDLLMVRAPDTKAVGDTAFDVSVTDGSDSRTTLRTGMDPMVGVQGAPLHVTGLAVVRDTTLVVRIVATKGQAAVAGLAVTSAAPGEATALLDDGFDGAAGTAPPARWTNETGSGPWGDTEQQGYSADRRHSALDGRGNLVITATDEDYTDQAGTRAYTSARLNTLGKASITYGHVEARLQAPPGQGLWTAIWGMGTNKPQVDWPRSGEIDVMEYLAADPSAVYGFLHGLGDEQDPKGYEDQRISSFGGLLRAGESLSDAMHVYAVDLQPDAVTFSLDGVPYLVASEADLRAGQTWPIGHPYFLIMNLAVGGWLGPADAGTPFPAELVIDRITATGWR